MKTPLRDRIAARIPARLITWSWRIAIAVAILSAVGYFSNPAVSPLMCKVYG